MDELDSIFEAASRARLLRNREVLLPDYVPLELPHRSEEIRRLAEVVAPALRGERPNNVFIYGLTGTGKTAVTKYVLRRLQELASQKGAMVQSIYVNVRQRETPYKVLADVAEQLGLRVPFTGLSIGELFSRIVKRLSRLEGVYIVVLDEIDFLVRRGDDVLYDLTRVNEHLQRARVSVIGITNSVRLVDSLDPIVEVPPLGMMRSLSRYLEASSKLRSPILFSAADVTEDVEADTLGVHALLSLMAVELRASAYLVVEETYKSYRSTAEAREALRLAETAWQLRSTERGMFSRLLVVKQDVRPPRAVQAAEAEEVGYVEPKVSADKYVVINADHERGRVVVTFFRDGSPQGAVAGRHALSVARAAVRRFGLDPEHAAYLGYELAKAEISLKLGKTYVQDEPLIVVPWERNGNSGC